MHGRRRNALSVPSAPVGHGAAQWAGRAGTSPLAGPCSSRPVGAAAVAGAGKSEPASLRRARARAAPAEAQAATICALGLRGFPDVMGGVETHCEQVYRRLSETTPHRYVVLGRSGYVAKRRRLGDRLEVIATWALRNKYLEAFPNALIALLHARFVVGARMAHIHAIGPGLVTPLAKLLGMKTVFTHHGQDYRRAKWSWLGKIVLRLGEAMAVRFADRVIVVSSSLTATLSKRYPQRASRIVHIPNGAAALHDAERRDGEAALRQFGLAPRKYVLGVGRLVPEKGFHDLLAAFRAANLPLKLVIAGGADHADLYSRRLLARGDADTIFTGVLTREQLWDLYRGASLFVLPSLHEGMPIAALEAIAAGAPALLSDIEANRDLGLPPAHYYPAGDVEALAQRLKGPHDELAPDRESVLARFDWNNIAAQTGMVYAEVLGCP